MADFQRDFGYLWPFLERVTQAARTADPPVRAELTSLAEGERARWQRIAALLSGEAGGPAGSEASAPRVRPGAPPVDDPVHTPVRGFTVGSLRRS